VPAATKEEKMDERKRDVCRDSDRLGWNVGLPDDILAESSDCARVQVLVHILRGKSHVPNGQILHHTNMTVLIPVKHPTIPMPGLLFAFDTMVIVKILMYRT
jgi:hypothetical protein